MKKIFSTNDISEAHMVIDSLGKQGIAASIQEGNAVTHLGQNIITILINDDDDEEKAKEVISEVIGSKTDTPPKSNKELKSSFYAGMFLGFLLCLLLVFIVYQTKNISHSSPTSWDSNGDGNEDIWAEYSNGKIAKYIYDHDYDGVGDAWHYYKEGFKERVELDKNHDTKIDSWEYYDQQGEINRTEYDLDYDGEVDYWEYYKDRLFYRAETDANRDGQVDVWQHFDSLGRLNKVECDIDFDGKVDYWEYFEEGRKYKYTSDNDRNGQVDEWGVFEKGQVKERNWSFHNDKIVDKKASYKNGLKLSESYDRNRDGTFEEVVLLDEFERVVSESNN